MTKEMILENVLDVSKQEVIDKTLANDENKRTVAVDKLIQEANT